MQKPSKLAQIPQIRFAGFTKTWEIRKLGEVAEFNPKSELPEIFEYVDLESVIGTEMISHRTETKASAPSRAQRLAKMGDVFYQTVRPYQRNNYLFDKPDNNYVFSTGYAQMRSSINSSFLMNFIQTDGFVKIVLDNCTGTSYPAINSSDLANLVITYPVNIKEQSKIGTYFQSLDKLITLHQSKFEKLQKIKKSCLQNLFPQNNQNTPKIRFKNFTDEWVKNKLGDTIISIPFKAYLANAEKIGNYPVIQQGDIPIAGYSNQEPFLDFCNVVLFGDHTLSLYNPKSPFLLASDGIKILSVKNLYDDFLFQLLKKYMPKSEGYKRHFSILKNICFYYPNSKEQEKIGAFFSKLDKLITLQQRKVEKLKNIKKALLNKMLI